MHEDKMNEKEQKLFQEIIEFQEKVKDLSIGDLIRIDGKVYEIKNLGASPAWSPHGTNVLLTLIEKEDLGEKLADLFGGNVHNKQKNKVSTWMRTGRHG